MRVHQRVGKGHVKDALGTGAVIRRVWFPSFSVVQHGTPNIHHSAYLLRFKTVSPVLSLETERHVPGKKIRRMDACHCPLSSTLPNPTLGL